MSEVQQMTYDEVVSALKHAVLKNDNRRMRELSRSRWYDKALDQIRKRMGVVASDDVYSEDPYGSKPFKQVDGYMFTKQLIDQLREVSSTQHIKVHNESDHYGYFISLEGVKSMADLVKLTTDCINRMGYDGYLEGETDDNLFLIAAVDEPAWVELTLSYYGGDGDCYIAVDARKGNVFLEDWYSE